MQVLRKKHKWDIGSSNEITTSSVGVLFLGEVGRVYTSVWMSRKEGARLLKAIRRSGVKVVTIKYPR